MTHKTTAAYGTWTSAINAHTLTAKSVRLSEPLLDNNVAYWLESRPNEGGRNVLMRQPTGGEAHELLERNISVRTRAHEYGGGCYLPTPEAVYAVFDSDQRLYKIPLNNGRALAPIALTPQGPYRYADFCIDRQHQHLIAVREDHRIANKVENTLVSIALNPTSLTDEQQVNVVVSGADFYSNPRLSPCGTQLAWLAWNHPQMPWDGTECTLAQLDNKGAIKHTQVIAGGTQESIFQPRWSPNGELFFVSDRSNWWNLYRYQNQQVQVVIDMAAEFATPQWAFGMSTYDFIDADNIICCYSRQGLWQLARLSRQQHDGEFRLEDMATPFSTLSAICCNRQQALFLAANAQLAPALYQLETNSIDKTLTLGTLKKSQPEMLAPEHLSSPEPITFTTTDNDSAHGFYYPPCNPNFNGPAQELPPLIVMCHGGPTGATDSALNYKIQFWTSRGFALLDVNYRGSTGYGRRYRDKLKNHWGETDVIDVVSGARYLVERQRAHPERLIIRGSSAGGYTVLAALTFTDTFAAGASLYGVGDLTALAEDTHKFESRYLDSLVGPYPEAKATYEARSPICHIEQLNCPVIFLQGLQDKVVPPAQAEAMVAALNHKGIHNRYVTFAEEGHGFRAADNIETAFTEELDFYIAALGLTVPEK